MEEISPHVHEQASHRFISISLVRKDANVSNQVFAESLIGQKTHVQCEESCVAADNVSSTG